VLRSAQIKITIPRQVFRHNKEPLYPTKDLLKPTESYSIATEITSTGPQHLEPAKLDHQVLRSAQIKITIPRQFQDKFSVTTKSPYPTKYWLKPTESYSIATEITITGPQLLEPAKLDHQVLRSAQI